jgi:hypothetical protein
MAVEQTTVIDFIGIDPVTGAVCLTIADALDWNADHLRLLQEKLTAYLSFVESGELYSAYPTAAGRPVVFELRLQHRPDAEATLFLEQARALIGKAGVALHYGPLASGYANDDA